MAGWDVFYGALQNVSLLGIQNVIHLRHPDTNKAMCDQTLTTLVPIGRVAWDDPSIHAACLTAWKTARDSMAGNKPAPGNLA